MSIRSSICAVCIAAVAALTGLSGAQAQPRPAVPPAAAPPVQPAAPTTQTSRSDEGYVLGPDDVVEVEVLGPAGFKQRSKIGVDGNITLPFVGAVPAAKRTSLQLGEDVKAVLEKGGFFINPIMRVEIVGYASRYVTVLGQVGSPGLVPVDRPYRLSELLARVGGVRPDAADYAEITPEKGETQKYSIKAAATGDPSQDPVVPPGARLFVRQAELVYVSGQVRAPGAFPIASEMTVRMLIAKAGGLTDIGSERSIKVTHKDGKVDKPGMSGKVQPGDVVVVGERLF
jgi:polysaccharide export outer membrane protein